MIPTTLPFPSQELLSTTPPKGTTAARIESQSPFSPVAEEESQWHSNKESLLCFLQEYSNLFLRHFESPLVACTRLSLLRQTSDTPISKAPDLCTCLAKNMLNGLVHFLAFASFAYSIVWNLYFIQVGNEMFFLLQYIVVGIGRSKAFRLFPRFPMTCVTIQRRLTWKSLGGPGSSLLSGTCGSKRSSLWCASSTISGIGREVYQRML